MLQLLAETSGQNIVVSDSVQGNVTLRLQNVPWDQALDIVLQHQGPRQAPRTATSSTSRRPRSSRPARRPQLEVAQGDDRNSSPVRTEYLQVNYAKASDLAALIKSQGKNARCCPSAAASRSTTAPTRCCCRTPPIASPTSAAWCDARHPGAPGADRGAHRHRQRRLQPRARRALRRRRRRQRRQQQRPDVPRLGTGLELGRSATPARPSAPAAPAARRATVTVATGAASTIATSSTCRSRTRRAASR